MSNIYTIKYMHIHIKLNEANKKERAPPPPFHPTISPPIITFKSLSHPPLSRFIKG